ncbi:MAG TPA: alkaline phosphatase family protein, partial [Thermoanaerobaculia bacterium]|nr:alkaline phosphatase family protein [Thermoanaerobaculia bacterium]
MTSSRSLRRLAAVFALLAGLAATGLAAEKPSLVVVISVDQMRADYLERFRPYFGKDGFNRFLERGAVFTEARHRHSYPETAPGHASIGSGLDPRHHGILSNRWFDPAAVRNPYVVSDPFVKWVPADVSGSDTPASPVRLDEASQGDRLKESYPKARVVGVALKDRAAVFMAGRKADAAVWFDTKSARFVTSTYYPPRPSLLAFNGAPLQKILADPKYKEWALSGFIPAADLENVAFDQPELFKYKDPVEGMGETFPHPIKTAAALTTSPFGDELVLEYARFAIRDLALGRNPAGAPDLLFIGMSSTDLYGHKYGPDSREIADGMVRLDRTLERFWRWLDAWLGKREALVFLTADHGVTPIPEVAREKARRAGTERPDMAGRCDMHNPRGKRTLAEAGKDRLAVERALASTLGYTLDETRGNTDEAAIVWFEDGFVYLNRPVLARRGLDLERVKSALADALRARTGVAAAYTNTQIGNGLPADAPGGLAVTRSFRADRAGDVYAILKPGWIWFYEKDAGTTHGEPNDDDLHVPVAAWGAGVAAGRYDTPTSPLAIAKTVG